MSRLLLAALLYLGGGSVAQRRHVSGGGLGVTPSMRTPSLYNTPFILPDPYFQTEIVSD